MNEEMLQQLMDRQAITDGLHWYTRWVDLNRVDKQVEIFTMAAPSKPTWVVPSR